MTRFAAVFLIATFHSRKMNATRKFEGKQNMELTCRLDVIPNIIELI